MKKIMILGSPGSGKFTLAKSIGEITGIEVIHLDTLFWNPGWIKVPSEEFKEIVKSYVVKEAWIMDGNYSGVLDIRLNTDDTIIFIDVPRGKCLYRVVKRRFQYKGKTRSDLTAGCDEKIDWNL
ncbi:P-loop NTPase family protein [Clostridium sp. Marseille-QA1073]